MELLRSCIDCEGSPLVKSADAVEKMATLLSKSLALRGELGDAKAPRLAFDVVMDGSVALARRSLGRFRRSL
jgi:hypothetical protein